MVLYNSIGIFPLLTPLLGHDHDTYIHVDGNGTADHLLPYNNDGNFNGNYCSVKGTAVGEAGHIETGTEIISEHSVIPCRRLFVWSSHDQSKCVRIHL